MLATIEVKYLRDLFIVSGFLFPSILLYRASLTLKELRLINVSTFGGQLSLLSTPLQNKFFFFAVRLFFIFPDLLSKKINETKLKLKKRFFRFKLIIAENFYFCRILDIKMRIFWEKKLKGAKLDGGVFRR